MSIALRNLEEKDLEALHALVQSHVGPALSDSPLLQLETLKLCLLVDTAFTLVAEQEDRILGMVAILMEQETPETVLGLLGRFCVPETPDRQMVAESLVNTALQSIQENLQVCFAEVPSSNLWAQTACEQSGFIVSGFLPRKLHSESHSGVVVYTYLNEKARNARRPHPKIISGAQDLAMEVLKVHGIIHDVEIREDMVGYPIDCFLTVTPAEADVVSTILQSRAPYDREVFNFLQNTQTSLHLACWPTQYIVAKEGEHIVGVVGYIYNPLDKKVQITEMMALEGEPQGFLMAHLIETLNQEFALDYWEVLVSAHAPRFQKTLDQLGFVCCAYLPAFALEHGLRSDALKMVKLNVGYETDTSQLTSTSKNIFLIIDTIFRENSIGAAVLKLLRDLRFFHGMGEGELRRVARLFSQKLLRPGEVVFEAGSTGRELYVVERGEIEICTKDGNHLLGTIRNGEILGEIAFLNGEPRTATAKSKSATIVRVIHRKDFDRLIQREMHLGLIFFQNVAIDLADKLKHAAQAKNE